MDEIQLITCGLLALSILSYGIATVFWFKSDKQSKPGVEHE